MNAFAEDLRRFRSGSEPTIRQACRMVIEIPGVQALAMYRLGRYLRAERASIQSWILQPFGWLLYLLGTTYVRACLGIRLYLDAEIGPGLYIGHFGRILLRSCRLGANCSISQSTQIAPNPGAEGGPFLGDRVWVGAHAQIIGAVRVGDGCTVSALARVSRDIPPGALCIGNPARVALRTYDNSRILNLASKSDLEATSGSD